jgi:hypothetical protein
MYAHSGSWLYGLPFLELLVEDFLETDEGFLVVKGVVFEFVDEEGSTIFPWFLACSRGGCCEADVVCEDAYGDVGVDIHDE